MFSMDYTVTPVSDIYGSNCFTETEMAKYLSDTTIRELKQVQRGQKPLALSLADQVAAAMKEWALKKGATHYCHWFQPLTGLTAEKHNSFISPTKSGKVLLEFSGRELIQGEGDASSLPNGGLRTTFEARGYTAWDTSSPAFIKEIGGEKILYIPTAFFSYTGEALDKKVPLLRSTAALEKQTLRVLHALGTKAKRVIVNIGPEQEYFLVDKELYKKRPDLRLAGRTVLGTFAAKGQELNDHYYGQINDKVSNFMAELNYELWKLGISSKTQHLEAAPNQFEVAVVYDAANLATDHNQLLMEILQSVAWRHGMVALLHEKPFSGVNGSGKHDNWSLSTDDGTNLLSPGHDAQENLQFLLFLTAFLKALDEYAPLIRCGAATAGNDFRLGGAEAPPAIISIFLGEQLTSMLDAFAEDKVYQAPGGAKVAIGVSPLPQLPLDLTDRNRTSPMAFTGNKFEFRMVGSSQSIASPVAYLNTIMAQELREAADELESAGATQEALTALIRKMLKEHRRIVFNGNGYDASWVEEAARRGLKNLRNTAQTIPEYASEKNIRLLTENGIYTRKEIESRGAIRLEKYCSIITIEARTLIEMVRKGILGSVSAYLASLSAAFGFEKKQKEEIGRLGDHLYSELEQLEADVKKLDECGDGSARLALCSDVLTADMKAVRAVVDQLERRIDSRFWPYPDYTELLFAI